MLYYGRPRMLSLLALALAVSFRFAFVAALKNSSRLDIAVNNHDTQLAAPEIDPRFQVVAEYHAEPIDMIGAYMTVLRYLKFESKWDFDGETPTYSVDNRPYNLRITAGTPDQGAFSRRFLIWGLYLSVHILARDNRYMHVVFHLNFDNREVATIVFEPLQSYIKSNATSHSPNALSGRPNGFDNDDEDNDIESSPNPAEYIKPYFVPRGASLSIPGTFLPLVAGMVHIAQQGIMTVVEAFLEVEVEENTKLTVSGASRTRPPPPPLLGTHCIKAIWRIAIFVTNVNSFREVATDVKIATILYGSLSIRQLMPGVDGDVATS